jgi:cellulose biosynthesis protein BcsQ
MTLLDKRLLIVGGKGGVGKSVIAAALALLAAQQGRRTLLLGVDSLDRFSSLLGYKGQEDGLNIIEDKLYSTILNPKSVANDFIETHVPIRTISKKLISSGVFNYWFEATPMLSELLMLGKIWKLATETKRRSKDYVWDTIVVEAPSTGHSLGLLGASETASQLLVGPMRSKADEITALLRDHDQVSLVIATLAEDMPVSEALELRRLATDKLKMHVSPLIVNAVFPKLVEADDLTQMKASTDEWSEALENACRYANERRERTEHFLSVIEKECPDFVQVPLITSARFGRAAVEELAKVLGRSFGGVDQK